MMSQANTPMAILKTTCADRRGIVATTAGFLSDQGANIIDAQQHTDQVHQRFFMRVEFELACDSVGELAEDFGRRVAEPFGMQWTLRPAAKIPVMGIMVSRLDHCLVDLLARCRIGELSADVPVVISNHPELEPIATN